jgi:Tol biopolymer transport system component
MFVAALTLLLASSAAPSPAPARRPPAVRDGDRDIVFSAQKYRYTGLYYREGGEPARHGAPDARILEDAGPFHLYRVNPDGTGMTRLTRDARADDTDPRWSPDGRSILFVRTTPAGGRRAESVCRTDPDGRRVRSLLSLPAGRGSVLDASWSPDGRTVAAVVREGGPDERHGASCLILLDAGTGCRLRKVFGVAEAAWSSTGRYLALADWEGQRPRLLDFRTGSVAPAHRGDGASGPLLCRVSLLRPAGTFVADIAGPEGVADGRRSCLFTPSETGEGGGRVTRKIAWHSLPASDDSNPGFPFDGGVEDRRWFGLPALGPDAVLAECLFGRSDGGERDVFRLDLSSGTGWLLHPGQLVAVSPDGRRCAVATDDWTGPYKRGGRRCGPLEIIATDLPPGHKARKGRAVTPPLMSFAGGDWRRPAPAREDGQ